MRKKPKTPIRLVFLCLIFVYYHILSGYSLSTMDWSVSGLANQIAAFLIER